MSALHSKRHPAAKKTWQRIAFDNDVLRIIRARAERDKTTIAREIRYLVRRGLAAEGVEVPLYGGKA